MKKIAIVALLALTLAGCNDDKVKSKKPVNYKTPTAAAPVSIKEGDKCARKGDTVTVNGKKLVCKRTTSGSYLRWRKA